MYPKQVISDQVRSLMKNIEDPWNVVRGHDAVSILAMALRENFGSYNAKYIKDGELAGALRLAYGPSYFAETRLYSLSEEWCGTRKMDLWLIR
jgi:hypothetical protein